MSRKNPVVQIKVDSEKKFLYTTGAARITWAAHKHDIPNPSYVGLHGARDVDASLRSEFN